MGAKLACAFGTSLVLSISLTFAANASSVGVSKLETDDLRLLYFDPIQTYLTPYVARSFENSFAFQRRTFDWTPWDKTTVFLRDLSDNGRAIVRVSPNNGLIVDIAPIYTTFETFTPGERFFTLMNHELVHVATLDVANDEDRWWRNAFHGKPLPIIDHPESVLYGYLAAPRTVSPRWYLEGSAVFMETWMGGGLGRAQGGYDEMVWRAMVRDDAHFFDPLGLESEGNNIDFQVGVNDYLYGTRFDTYLALTYGPAKLIEWLKRGNDSDRYYATQFERVFGKPLDQVWQEWIQFEHKYQKANIAALEKYPTTKGRYLTDRSLGSISRTYYDPKTDSIIGAFRYPGVLGHVGVLSLKDGSIRRLTYIKGPALYRVTSLAYDPDGQKVWYTTDNNTLRGLMEIDLKTGDTKTLLEGDRIGELAFNPKDGSLWGIRTLNGFATIVRLPPPYTSWNQVYTYEYGQAAFDLDVSPDGQWVSVSLGEINGDQRIGVYRMADLMAGNVKEVGWLSLGQAIPEGGVFSPDSRYVYASAYYTGVSNIYRYELATGKVEPVTNAVTGFFRPIPRADGSLIVYEYTGQGFRPMVIDNPKPLTDLGTVTFLGTATANNHPELKTWGVGSPAKIPLDQMITARGEYDPQAELHLDATYPVVQAYKSHVGIGWYAQFEDPLQFNQLTVNLSYSPAGDIRPGEQYHAQVDYHTLFWRIGYWHNKGDFYDLFGPTDRSRKGDAIIGGYHEVPIWDPPRQLDFDVEVGLYSGLDTLPAAQNVQTNDKQIAEIKVGLNYVNTDQSLGSVDYEAGNRWNVEAQGDYARSSTFPKFRGGYDFGFPLPWNHSSLWIYSEAGIALGSNQNALNDFYFGAFGNNYVDDKEVKRYREYDSFPGFDIDEIPARNFVKTVLEWNLPPIRFADIGSPGFYLGSVRSAMFTGVLAADPGATTSRTVGDIGFQIDLNFTIAVRLPMTFSVGFAHGIDGGGKDHNEAMASLKIL